MAQAIVTYVGEMPSGEGGNVDTFRFVPCFEATVDGVRLLKAWVQLSMEGGVNAKVTLRDRGYDIPKAEDAISDALLKYGARRMELVVADILAGGTVPDQGELWELGTDDVAELLALTDEKTCRYQRPVEDDLFCVAASPADKSVTISISGKRAAPTTRAFCAQCAVPDKRVICSRLRHVEVTGMMTAHGVVDRRLTDAMCDIDRPEVRSPGKCRAGGNECWARLVSAEERRPEPISLLSLPESFDVLDAMWRLVFGTKRRLLSLNTVMTPAALVRDCTNRSEFEARLSALADIIDRLRVDDDLLPPNLSKEHKNGSINRLEQSLCAKLSAEQHGEVHRAITLLRRIRQTRNAMQHSAADRGFTQRLRELGIHDAPPNWEGAWATTRQRAVEALTIIRTELRRWLDSQPER